MSPLKKLAGQTAIYGVSSILGRLINYLLTPFYTRIFFPEEYGVITNLYALIAFLMVILTYGMETTYFRFASEKETTEEKNRTFTTVFYSVLTSTSIFVLIAGLFTGEIAEIFDFAEHPEYIFWSILIVALDAVSSIPLARLRLINRPIQFLSVNLGSILVNIGFNLFFLVFLRNIYLDNPETSNWFVTHLYNPDIGIGYVFISNLLSSIFKLLVLSPAVLKLKFHFGRVEWRRMMPYTLPLMLLGLAGIVNETFDRLFFVQISGFEEGFAKSELGIYGACYKVAMLVSIGIQAFRYAAEPFIFSLARNKDSTQTYAAIMKYYFIAALFISLGILCFEDLALLLIGEDYREGAFIIPILLVAYILFGAVFNLSFWYKLTDRTRFGALIAVVGAAITIVVNLWLVPQISYEGSAWATLAAYAAMFLLSYILGQKYYPIPYPIKTIGAYVLLAVAIFVIRKQVNFPNEIVNYGFSALLLFVFGATAYFRESKAELSK